MEQTIQAAASGKAESKAFSPADLVKMIDAANGKDKGEKTKPGKEEDDINALAPFLQLLNQQMTLLFQTNTGSGTDLINKDGEKITLEQAKLLFQGNLDLKDLQQVLAKSAQSEFPGDSLLKEIDLLEKNLAAGDAKGKDILLNALLGQTMTDQTLTDAEKETISDALTAALNKKSTAKEGDNGDGLKILNNDDSVLLNDKNSDITLNTSLLAPGTELKKAADAKLVGEADINNLQSKSGVGDGEVKIKTNQPVLKNDEKTLKPEAIKFQEVQLSESSISKVSVNSAAAKEDNQIGKNILPEESAKADQATPVNSRISSQALKDSLISKDNLRFAQEQYQNAAANANAADKAKIESMQAILGELSDKSKPEQKAKPISGEIRNEETTLSTINGTGSGMAKTEKTNNVSPGEIINQITNEIKETAANDGGRVKITLNPPSLGTLEMDVIVRNGKVDVVLTADNKDVQQTLNSHIEKLKGSLQTQGLTIQRCDVLMQDRREEYQQSFSQHAFYQQGSGQDKNSRQDNSEEKLKFNVTAATKQRSNILTTSTDKISLFA